MRHCIIVSASIEEADGGGDGAYDLHNVAGDPKKIGDAIAYTLRVGDMYRGLRAILAEEDGELYLNLRIKFANHPVVDEDAADPLTALESCVEWMEQTIPQLKCKCPHCHGEVLASGLNWGGPLGKARAAIAKLRRSDG